MLWREGDLTTPGGTYVLRFHVRSALEVAFGRFRAGQGRPRCIQVIVFPRNKWYLFRVSSQADAADT
jgi:hypothetical protein